MGDKRANMRIEQYDVVVAGCGVADLSAAVAAAEAGQRVVIVERASRDERGGQSRYTEAYLRMKSETAVTDDFETHIAENSCGYVDPALMAETGDAWETSSAASRGLASMRPEVIQTLADEAAPTIAWLKGFGVRFDFLPTQFLTKSQPRLLPVGGGQALVDALAAQAESSGGRIFYQMTATRLTLDEDGSVAGIVARATSAGRIAFSGKVVLACGGFEGNSEMLTRYIGPRSVYLRPICKGAYFNRGEGIDMALAIGAAPAGDFGSYHAEPIDPRSGVSEPSVFVFPYGILVNKDGKRFTDEAPGTVDACYERITRRIFEQREGLAWVVLDAKHARIPNYRLSIRTDKPPIVGNSLPELAASLQIAGDALAATVEQFNRACVRGEFRPLELDGLATRGLDPKKSNW